MGQYDKSKKDEDLELEECPAYVEKREDDIKLEECPGFHPVGGGDRGEASPPPQTPSFPP